MSRRRRVSRTVDAGHGNAHERAAFRKTVQFAAALRRIQLFSAAVMLLGLTIAMVVLVGEFKLFWMVGAGGALFTVGLLLFALGRPLARWWTREG